MGKIENNDFFDAIAMQPTSRAMQKTEAINAKCEIFHATTNSQQNLSLHILKGLKSPDGENFQRHHRPIIIRQQ